MRNGKWVARISQLPGRAVSFIAPGSFSSEVAAARAFDRARLKLGRTAVNFPDYDYASGSEVDFMESKRRRLAAKSNGPKSNPVRRASTTSSATIGIGDRVFVEVWGNAYQYTVESITPNGVAQLSSVDGGEDAQANVAKCLHVS